MDGDGLIGVEDRRGMVRGLVAIVASVLLHVVAGAVLLSVKMPGFGDDSKLMTVEEVVKPLEQEDELRLGLTEAKSASIDWLGVNDPEPVAGEAAISETNQAAQAIVVGESIEVIPEVVSEEAPVEPVEEVIEVAVVEPVVEPVAEPVEEPVEEIETPIEDAVVVAVEAKPIEVEPAEVEPVEPREAKESVTPNPKQKPVPVGTAGVLSKRESIATRIKRAIEVDPHKPNAPIVGKGLEIKTVHPRYPTAVRLSALPKNPVVVILFDAKGKVSKAEFLRDGRKVYSSGSPGVDGPLLNAIYQWRAKGKQIDALDVDDPKSLVEVTIKIVYQKERKGKSD